MSDPARAGHAQQWVRVCHKCGHTDAATLFPTAGAAEQGVPGRTTTQARQLNFWRCPVCWQLSVPDVKRAEEHRDRAPGHAE